MTRRFEIITEADARQIEYGTTVELAAVEHVTPLARYTLNARRISVVLRIGGSVAPGGFGAGSRYPPRRDCVLLHGRDSLRRRLCSISARAGWRSTIWRTDGTAPVDYPDTAARVAQSVADADLVIEAVPEQFELKVATLADVAARVGPETLIASNTSSIPIAQLASGLPAPERVLGLHFFSPVPVMKLVEVVVALETSAETVAAAGEFARRIGKDPIETGDRSGFIVNMLLVPYLMAAVRMYEEGSPTPSRSTAACSSAAGTRWARSPSATSSASTSSTASATRSMRSSSSPPTRRRRC